MKNRHRENKPSKDHHDIRKTWADYQPEEKQNINDANRLFPNSGNDPII